MNPYGHTYIPMGYMHGFSTQGRASMITNLRRSGCLSAKTSGLNTSSMSLDEILRYYHGKRSHLSPRESHLVPRPRGRCGKPGSLITAGCRCNAYEEKPRNPFSPSWARGCLEPLDGELASVEAIWQSSHGTSDGGSLFCVRINRFSNSAYTGQMQSMSPAFPPCRRYLGTRITCVCSICGE